MAGISHRSIVENMPIFRIAGQHRRIFAEGFSGIFLWFQIKRMCFRIASEKKLFHIASDLGVCDSNRIAHRGCMAQFGPLSIHVIAIDACVPWDTEAHGKKILSGICYVIVIVTWQKNNSYNYFFLHAWWEFRPRIQTFSPPPLPPPPDTP